MSRWQLLTAKVDGFFSRVEARHTRDLQCSSGCSDCCHTRLTVTGVEAAAIRAELEAWAELDRRALASQAAAAPADRCAALDPAGRCAIYAARPLVCRSHGAPIRLREHGLPIVQACFRNFTRTGPAAADADCILDQETLSALLLAVDREAGGDGSRYDLAELLRSAAE